MTAEGNRMVAALLDTIGVYVATSAESEPDEGSQILLMEAGSAIALASNKLVQVWGEGWEAFPWASDEGGSIGLKLIPPP